jgi:hypothetical protein
MALMAFPMAAGSRDGFAMTSDPRRCQTCTIWALQARQIIARRSKMAGIRPGSRLGRDLGIVLRTGHPDR